jgi:hypothetical protein
LGQKWTFVRKKPAHRIHDKRKRRHNDRRFTSPGLDGF